MPWSFTRDRLSPEEQAEVLHLRGDALLAFVSRLISTAHRAGYSCRDMQLARPLGKRLRPGVKKRRRKTRTAEV